MKQTKLVLAIASIVVGVTASSFAQATPTASAESIVTIDNLVFNWDPASPQAGAQLSSTDFSSLTVSTTEQTAASVGASSITSPVTSTSTAASISNTASLGAVSAFGAPVAAEIAANPGNPSTVFTPAPLPALGNAAASGSNQVGSPISNFNGALPTTTLHNASYATLDNTTGVAGTNTTTNISSKFTFALTKSGVVDISFGVTTFLSAYLTAGAANFAQAASSITFKLVDLTHPSSSLDFASSPAFINPVTNVFSYGDTISDNTPGVGTQLFSGLNGTIPKLTFKTVNLVAGDVYSLQGSVTTNANVSLQTVPEPASLALLGIGLLGMGIAASRNSKSAAFKA